MVDSFKLTELSGNKNFKIATTDVQEDETVIRSPDWLVKIDSLLSSNIDDYKDFCEIFGWHEEASRLTSGNITQQLLGSANLKHSGLIAIVPNGAHGASMELSMNRGIPINYMAIVRLGNIKGKRVRMQLLEYKICWLQSIQQQLDRLVLHFSISYKKNTLYVFAPDGASKGQIVSEVDYIKGTVDG